MSKYHDDKYDVESMSGSEFDRMRLFLRRRESGGQLLAGNIGFVRENGEIVVPPVWTAGPFYASRHFLKDNRMHGSLMFEPESSVDGMARAWTKGFYSGEGGLMDKSGLVLRQREHV